MYSKTNGQAYHDQLKVKEKHGKHRTADGPVRRNIRDEHIITSGNIFVPLLYVSQYFLLDVIRDTAKHREAESLTRISP